MCVLDKAQVVKDDEFETTGRRAILNFGHTVGHAVERELGYEGLLHGEAISVGMVVEARLGEEIGVTEAGTADQVRADLEGQGLPVDLPRTLSPTALVQAMQLDKKARVDGLAFSLLTQMGECKMVKAVKEEAVMEALKQG